MADIVKSIDAVWEQIHSTREWGRYPTEAVIRFVARNFYRLDRKNVRILDFGCGQGAHTWYLAREGFDTYAFDGSESAVRRTKEYLDKEQVQAEVKVMDGIALDYEDNYFDAVIDSACIGHSTMANIIAMYHGIYRVLKPGGQLFTTFFSMATSGYGEGKSIEPGTFCGIENGPLGGEGVTHFWQEEELKRTLENIGFSQVKIEKMMYTTNSYVVENLNAVCVKA